MTYILNAIPIGSKGCVHEAAGRLLAEPDEPTTGFLQVAGETLIGTRYLIVTNDGTGYTSSVELVDVPHDNHSSTHISIPVDLRSSFKDLTRLLLEQSPEQRMAIYLEANRSISRADPDDPFPSSPIIIAHRSLNDFLRLVDQFAVEEDQIHIVES